jgi:hypothetical protein
MNTQLYSSHKRAQTHLSAKANTVILTGKETKEIEENEGCMQRQDRVKREELDTETWSIYPKAGEC